MKKLLCYSSAIVFLFLTMLLPVQAVERNGALVDDPLARQFESCMQYNNLIESFTTDGEVIYPDYYAGAYISETKDLVIQVTDVITSTDIEQIKTVTGNENIILEYGLLYSMNDLCSIQDKFVTYLENHDDGTNEICNSLDSISICNKNNSILVEVPAITEQMQNQILIEVLGASARSAQGFPITFIQGDVDSDTNDYEAGILDENWSDTFAIKPGSEKVYAGSPIGFFLNKTFTSFVSGRVGFPCTRTVGNKTQYGFITAGHVTPEFQGSAGINTAYLFEYRGVPSYDSSVPPAIGSLRVTKVEGKVDAAFVEDGYNGVSEYTLHGAEIYQKIVGKTSVPEGTEVFGVSDFLARGTVSSTKRVTTIEGKTLSDLYYVKWSDEGILDGDSGGPLYILAGSEYEAPVYILGILSSGSTTNASYCKINNILNDTSFNVKLEIPR